MNYSELINKIDDSLELPVVFTRLVSQTIELGAETRQAFDEGLTSTEYDDLATELGQYAAIGYKWSKQQINLYGPKLLNLVSRFLLFVELWIQSKGWGEDEDVLWAQDEVREILNEVKDSIQSWFDFKIDQVSIDLEDGKAEVKEILKSWIFKGV